MMDEPAGSSATEQTQTVHSTVEAHGRYPGPRSFKDDEIDRQLFFSRVELSSTFRTPPFSYTEIALDAMMGFLCNRVGEVEPFALQLVRQHEEKRIWNDLMLREHPLGDGPLVGRQLRYLIGSRHARSIIQAHAIGLYGKLNLFFTCVYNNLQASA
jgi:hypothetical protein